MFVQPAAGGDGSGQATHAGQGSSHRVNTDASASLTMIVNRELQNGHYAEGEKALRRYLRVHPDDQEARMFLRQLTEDPKAALGEASSPHIVQPGESYSTLAEHYLGDPNLFVVLARYNGSNDPALIRTESTIQLPVLRHQRDGLAHVVQAKAAVSSQQMAPVVQASVPPLPALAGSVGASGPVSLANVARPMQSRGNPGQEAKQLGTRSVALYRQGHEEKALATLDQALLLDPKLASTDPAFVALRQTWIMNQHQQAMVLYLDQQPGQAVALWNRVLAVDPGYEPALIYRLHALELQRHMKAY